MKRNPDRRTSIRKRLLGWLIAPVAVALGLGSIGDLVSTEAPIREAYDRALSDAAIALALNVQVDDQGRVAAHVPPEALNLLRTDLSDDVYFRISAPDVPTVAGEADLPAAPAAQDNPAHATEKYRGKAVRIATFRTHTRSGTVAVTVAETLNKRQQIRERLWSAALWQDLAELLVVLALVWIGVRLALKPLDELGEQIARQGPNDLTPIGQGQVPLELAGLVDRLNDLLATLAASSEAERQFLGNAAHQLRTPLAGVLSQLELLVADEADQGQRDRLLQVHEAACRLSRTTNQLLTLARSEHRAHTFAQHEPCDLAAIAASSIAMHVARAAEAGIDLGGNLQAATIQGIEWLLREALDNLLDNALTYTRDAQLVTVHTGISAGRPFVEVVDTGSGIPAEERALLPARFHRGRQARGMGSGLGLSIVAEVARLHGATLLIAAGPGEVGTSVRIDFPGV